jgi:hypothetical protein
VVKPTWLAVPILALTILAAPGGLGAQGPRAVQSAAAPLSRPRVSHGDPRVPPIDLHELSKYAGWGGTIGAALGVAYALAFEPGRTKGIVMIWNGFVGFTCGLVVGAGVYVVKAVRDSH